MTSIVFKNDNLVLPKLIDLSANLRLKPLNKKSIKSIIKLREEITSPKKNLIKNMKKTYSRNYNLSRATLTNELLSEKLNPKHKLKIVTSDDFLTNRKVDNENKENNKFKTIINNSYRPIKLKKVKAKIKENLKLSPIKLLSPKSNISKLYSRNYSERGNNILNSKKTSYTENKLTIENNYNNNTKIITEFSPLDYNLKDEEELDEETAYEKYDSFNDRNLEETYILKVVTDFLRSKDNKLNQVSTNQEKFYNSFENRINFIFDIIGVPCFKNHFIKLNATKESVMNNISNNLVETGIHYYLNKLRVKYQRQFDESEEKKKLELLKEKNYNKQNTLKEKEKMDEFDNAEQAFKEVIPKTTVIEINKEIDYDTEDYFSLKLIRFENVKLADLKERNAIFKYQRSKKSKYRDSILKQFVNNDD